MFTHIVLFKLNDVATTEKTIQVLRSLEGNVPTLRQIEVGEDVLRSARSFDVALVTRFTSLADMEAYQAHPFHQEVLAYMRKVVESSVAVDFETED